MLFCPKLVFLLWTKKVNSFPQVKNARIVTAAERDLVDDEAVAAATQSESIFPRQTSTKGKGVTSSSGDEG